MPKLTKREIDQIGLVFNDWKNQVIAGGAYPQFLIAMQSPHDVMICRLPEFDKQKLIIYLQIIIDQLVNDDNVTVNR